MGIAIPRPRTVLAAICAIFVWIIASAGFGPAFAATPANCDDIFNGDSPPTVTAAYNEEVYLAGLKNKPDIASDGQKNTAIANANTIALGDVVSVQGDNLKQLFEKPCDRRVVVLFLNGLPMVGITPRPASNPKGKVIHFTLRRNEEARAAWASILGSPFTNSGKVSVSVGFKDGFPALTQARQLNFTIVPEPWFAGWAVFVVVMFGLFIWLTRRSNIIRDPTPAGKGTGTFSLSRMQGAWWFFVIIAAYLFIGTITGDFSNSVNSTALILLGIGAGTVIGSAAIDAQKDTDKERGATAAAIKNVQAELDASTDPIQQKRLASQLKKLKGESEGVFKDILSDANGISFHRFQIMIWTIVLGFIFIIAVYQGLEMPTFNTTLMGMLGLSAGTYLGLKIPEPTTPTKPEKPAKPT